MVARFNHCPNHHALSRPLSATAGFVLTEILLVISIIAILSTLVLIAVNPAQRLAESANTQRQSDLSLIRNALEAYATANNGSYPTTNGEYWCQNCTYAQYEAKGVNSWIPELVADGFLKYLPEDAIPSTGTACNPNPSDSYAGYVYVSPAPPNNKDYKLFAFCTPPKSALNIGEHSSATPYCSNHGQPPYDNTSFNPRPAGQPELRPFVDPVRPHYAYAIYTPGLACL
jgi:type II secretory pathway pseudopilin PulG